MALDGFDLGLSCFDCGIFILDSGPLVLTMIFEWFFNSKGNGFEKEKSIKQRWIDGIADFPIEESQVERLCERSPTQRRTTLDKTTISRAHIDIR